MAIFLPGQGLAHSPIPGIKGFYIGLLHPLTSPAQVLALLALGVAFGLRWPRLFAMAWAAFAGCYLVGIALGQAGVPVASAEPALLALAFATGAFAALWPSGPAAPLIAAAGAAGLLIGIVSTPDPGSLRSTVITLTGSFVGAVVALLYAAGGLGWLYERTSAAWLRIGFRIAAAWISAIAALILALALAAPR